jgi:hypothetical protein
MQSHGPITIGPYTMRCFVGADGNQPAAKAINEIYETLKIEAVKEISRRPFAGTNYCG